MRFNFNLVLLQLVMLISIHSSLQSNSSSKGDLISDGAPIRKSSKKLHPLGSSSTASHPSLGASSSEFHPLGAIVEFPDIVNPLDGAYSPGRSSPPAQSALRHRSRSPAPRLSLTSRSMVPPTRLPSSNGVGYGLEHLKLIRLISDRNPKQIFEFRRYTFPENTPLRLKKGRIAREPMPILEQIVMSTPNGDVYAILESSNVLAGIYISHTKRAKMSMTYGTVTALTTEEVAETPVGRLRPIPTYFKVILVGNV